MPTAARLVAAVLFAALAFAASEAYKPLLPEGTPTPWLSQVNALIGALSGWFVMGRHAGPQQRHVLALGLRTIAVLVFYVLLAHSIWRMVVLSMRLRYGGPMEAVVGIFEEALAYGTLLVTSPLVMGILLIGGTAAAYLTQFVARRWK